MHGLKNNLLPKHVLKVLVTLLVSEQQISEWFKLPYNRAYAFELSKNISYFAKILRTLITTYYGPM